MSYSIFNAALVKVLRIILCLMIFSSISKASDTVSNNCLSQSDAEKILGQSARLTANSVATEETVLKYRCTYTGILKESKTGKKENLYYQLEKYKDTSSAHNVFRNIIVANEKNHRIEILKQTGNEAIFLSDHINYHLIIVRKNNKILRFKVNKVTSLTSLNELQKVARNIASEL